MRSPKYSALTAPGFDCGRLEEEFGSATAAYVRQPKRSRIRTSQIFVVFLSYRSTPEKPCDLIKPGRSSKIKYE